VQEAKVSPMVFQVYAAVAVGLTSLLVLTYNKFVWSWWGTLGAGLWMASQPFAFFAINLLGVSLGPAIWAGATIAVSFIWGTALFGEPVKSLALCIVAILILVAGICGVTASGTQLPHMMMARLGKYHAVSQQHPDEPDHPGNDHEEGTRPGSVNDDSEHKSGTASGAAAAAAAAAPAGKETPLRGGEMSPLRTKLLGVLCALVMGVMNGSLMVPFTLFVQEQEGGGDGSVVELGYLVSFAIGIAIVTPPIFALFFLVARQRPEFHFKVAVLPGLTTGLLWSIGNFCSLYATLYLGSTVGYPLTQSCIVISALWGVFYFKEIHGAATFVLALSTAVVLGGAAMLTYFGDG